MKDRKKINNNRQSRRVDLLLSINFALVICQTSKFVSLPYSCKQTRIINIKVLTGWRPPTSFLPLNFLLLLIQQAAVSRSNKYGLWIKIQAIFTFIAFQVSKCSNYQYWVKYNKVKSLIIKNSNWIVSGFLLHSALKEGNGYNIYKLCWTY